MLGFIFIENGKQREIMMCCTSCYDFGFHEEAEEREP